MSPRKIEIDPELVAEGKRVYEMTATPLRDLAGMMGISRRTLENRIREWNWKRRRVASRPIELLHAVRGAAIATLTDDAPGRAANAMPVSSERRHALAERIQGVVEREIAAVERVLAVVGPSDQVEAEGSARTLASIARTLREISALNLPDPSASDEAKAANDIDDDAIPQDMDEFRRELARRIHAIVDAQRREESGGDNAADAESHARAD
jgi:hypothetical protein